MSFNLPMEGTNYGGSERSSTSDCGPLVLALKELVKKEVEVTVIHTVERIIMPMVENLIRKVVKEEIVSATQKFIGDRNLAHEISTSTECRSLQLKFLDEVSLPVLTGKEIKPIEGPAMRLAIVDNTGKFVSSGPAASEKVEILVLQVNHDDNEQNWSTENFNNRIIRENDKKKPHFSKSMYVQLKEGIGFLNNVKLGHDSSWMKSCECRLGARVVDSCSGSTVKEAWTKPFMVQDSRSKLYGKCYPPSLRDEVWRLENIGKDGVPCKRLRKEEIFTVQDFLFFLSADPQRLQNKINLGSKMWKATVDHARTCIIDDKTILLYGSPSEFEFAVAFDVVAQLRGIIRGSHYVSLDNMSDVEKARAQELILQASKNRKDITSMVDENSVVDRFPYESNCIYAATNSTIMKSTKGCDLTISECNDERVPSEPGASSQIISTSLRQSNNFGSYGSEIVEHISDPSLAAPDDCPNVSIDGLGFDWGSSCPFNDLFSLFGLDDSENVMPLTFPQDEYLSKTVETESSSDQQQNAGIIRLPVAVTVTLWMFRMRKRVTGCRDDRIRKRQRSR